MNTYIVLFSRLWNIINIWDIIWRKCIVSFDIFLCSLLTSNKYTSFHHFKKASSLSFSVIFLNTYNHFICFLSISIWHAFSGILCKQLYNKFFLSSSNQQKSMWYYGSFYIFFLYIFHSLFLYLLEIIMLFLKLGII